MRDTLLRTQGVLTRTGASLDRSQLLASQTETVANDVSQIISHFILERRVQTDFEILRAKLAEILRFLRQVLEDLGGQRDRCTERETGSTRRTRSWAVHDGCCEKCGGTPCKIR